MISNSVRITVLVDNKPGNGLTSEHGLALWIEVEGFHILFDTGQGHALIPNARRLKVPLEKTDFLVLSHGHYDHTGGVGEVLQRAPKARLILHKNIMADRYSVLAEKSPHAIGMPQPMQNSINQLSGERIMWTEQPLYLTNRICVTGAIPRDTSFEDAGGSFFLDLIGKSKDPVADDQALWIKRRKGIVICVGCSHAGLINTINYAMQMAGESVLRAVIGGFHLINSGTTRLQNTVEALTSLGPGMLIPCHCSGDDAVRFLQSSLGDRVSPCCSGMVFEF